MALDQSEELSRDRGVAPRSFSASLMSNTKWRAVFSTLIKLKPGIRQIIVKFVGAAEPKPMGLPWLSAPIAFVDSFEFGPIPLISIEWIEVPALALFPRPNGVPAERLSQNLEAVQSALAALGKRLPVTQTATGVRIVGHVR